MNTNRGLAPIPFNKGGQGVVLWVIIATVVFGGGYAAYQAKNKKTETVQAIQILTPRTGEKVIQGQPYTLTWNGGDTSKTVCVSIYPHPEGKIDFQKCGLEDTGAYLLDTSQLHLSDPKLSVIKEEFELFINHERVSGSRLQPERGAGVVFEVMKPSARGGKLDFSSCIGSLYQSNRAEYDFWKKVFARLHPEFQSIYDAGSYCDLTDGTKLISFSHFRTTDQNSAGQTVVLFDAQNHLVRETKRFYCKTVGDLGTPTFDSITGDILKLSCVSVDAGYAARQEYELNLNDFTYRKVSDRFEPVQLNSGSVQTADWKTYRNEEYGFEFKHPTGWKVNDQSFTYGGTPSINVLVSSPIHSELVPAQDAVYLLQVGVSSAHKLTVSSDGFFKSPFLHSDGGPVPLPVDSRLLEATSEHQQAQKILSTFRFTK